MSARLALVLLAPLAACFLEGGSVVECEEEWTCGHEPRSLDFEGARFGDFPPSRPFTAPHPTLVGGTQDIRLGRQRGSGVIELDWPYVADDDGGAGVRIERTDGAIVTVRGVAPQRNHLRITAPDGTLLGDSNFSGATLEEIRILPSRPEQTRWDDEFVFAAGGALELTVALFSGSAGSTWTGRIVDQSMAIEFPGATRMAWDTVRVSERTPGHHAILVTAGDRPQVAVDLEVVAGLDLIQVHESSAVLALAGSTQVCFSGYKAVWRYVFGLDWAYETDNGTVEASESRNCARISPARAGALTLTVSAGGKTLVKTYEVLGS